MRMHSTIAALLLLVFAQIAEADIVFTGSPLPTESFNSLPASLVSGVFSATIGVQTAIPGTTGFDGAKIAGTGTIAQPLRADDGGDSTGAIYSYGADSTMERALGSIGSGANVYAFGFSLLNSSAQTVTDITVSFTQENWRQGSSANTTSAAWASSATAGVTTSNYLSVAGFTAVSALDLSLSAGTNGPLDGNLPANQIAKTFTFSSLNIAPGGRFFLRWQDSDSSGADAGLAIDDMTLTIVSTAVPEATSLFFGSLALSLMGISCLARKLARAA